MNIDDLPRFIDHTLLLPEATSEGVDALCDEAAEYGFYGICVNPVYVARVRRRLEASARPGRDDRRSVVVSVSGFPLGASLTATKVDEARRAIDDGATEIDMVVNVGALIAGDRRTVRSDIEAVARVVHAAPGGMLKVILETRVLSEDQILMGCRCCAEGEADFVKTTTGLHPSGGATVEHVRLLHRHASPIKVKAAGGIRTAETTLAMIEAGAARIGTSAGVAIVEQDRLHSAPRATSANKPHTG